MKKILLFLFSLTLFFSLTLKEGNAVWMYPTDPLNPPAGPMTIEGKLLVDETDTECLLVRKDADGGDVFTVDCTNMFIYLGASAVSGDAVKIGSTNISSSGFKIITNETPTATNPVYTVLFGGASDNDTGRGSAGADIISDIAGGVEAQRLTEASREIEATTTVCVAATDNVNTTAAHALVVDDVVVFTAGTVCTGLTSGTNYYVQSITDANNFKVSATRGGGAIDLTDTGTAFTSSELEITVNIYGDIDTNLTVKGNNATIKIEDDSGNYSIFKTGNSQLTISADPDNAVASTDIVFEIDGVEVGRFEQGKGFQSKKGFATELWDVVGGNWEIAEVNTEYYSPNQNGGIYGTIYRQYFNTVLTSTNPRLDTGSRVIKMVDYVLHTKYTGNDRGVGHGNMTAYGTSTDHAYLMLSGASGGGNLSLSLTGYTVITGWVDYTK